MDGDEFCWTVVYGCNLCIERKRLWESIQAIANDMNIPWIIQGDCSAILNIQGVGGNIANGEFSQDFVECVAAASLIKLRYKGCFYTWTNNQEQESRISRKLDRCLVNLARLEKFALSEYEALPSRISKHSPLIVSIGKGMESCHLYSLICGLHILNVLGLCRDHGRKK